MSSKDSGLPQLKRRRVEDDAGEEATENPAFERSPDYWFNDGNIVLQVEKTLFRVHRSMLALHSNVFKDMVSIPQPEIPGEPTVDGCPVVALSDRKVDMEAILYLIYHGLSGMNPCSLAVPIAHVSAMLRLGVKYDMEQLRLYGLRVLKHEFPSTLEDFEAGSMIDYGPIPGLEATILVINLALELSLETILPCAIMCVYGNATVADLILKENDEVSPALATLDERTQGLFIIGHHRLVFLLRRLEKEYEMRASQLSRQNSCACRNVPLTLYHRFPLWIGDEKDMFELSTWSDDYPGMTQPGDLRLCEKCMDGLQAIHSEIRNSIWLSLPTLFGFPDWDALKDGITT